MSDADITATSVSKGCFAFKGKHARAREENYLPKDKDKFVSHRLELYREVWEELHVHINMLRSDLNTKMFDDLISFAAQCHKDRHSDVDAGWQTGRAIGEIPTAVLITGVNTPDHSIMFSNLDNMLRSRVTPLVARIHTKDCVRVATLVCSLVTQLTNITPPTEEEEGGEGCDGLTQPTGGGESPIKLKPVVKNRRSITMSTLVKWYKKEHASGGYSNGGASPIKKAKIVSPMVTREFDSNSQQTENKPLIVVMIEDTENIRPSVLQDFISLCSTHLTNLPIVLVMGIATAVTAIHQLLPASVSSLLCMEKYQAPPASQYLTQLLDRIVMAPELPFKLGPKVFHFLLDIFLYHDFSIVNFTMGFQHCMIEHFLSNRLSLLCCLKEDVVSKTSGLTHAQLEDIRRQPPFMRFVEQEKDSSVQAKLLTDDTFTRHHLATALNNLHDYHNNMFAALRFLHHLALKLPRYPLGKQLREIYSACLSGNHLCESEGYTEAMALLRMMSLDDLCTLLKGGLDLIAEKRTSCAKIEQLCSDVEGFVYRLDHIEEEPTEEEKEVTNDGDGTEGEGRRLLPQRTKLHELKERLQSISSRRRKSPYEKLRDEIMDRLHQHFDTLLGSPMLQPLHEILYFNDLSAVRDQLKAAPRCSTQRALVQPGRYLNCACCQCEPQSILPTMPDLCIVYKLHLECGTLVNLYDWLQAFITIVSSSTVAEPSSGVSAKPKRKNNAGGGGSKASQRNPSIELRARFIRAVSELQFLGFIKSTRRKTDHVTRLTW